MKKFDFSLGGGREVLSREQMKSVTGGLYAPGGGGGCISTIYVDGDCIQTRVANAAAARQACWDYGPDHNVSTYQCSNDC